MEKTAKEMFEELGYEDCPNLAKNFNASIVFAKRVDDYGKDKFIVFKDTIHYCVESPFIVVFSPTDDEQEAIVQQMKELGWIE